MNIDISGASVTRLTGSANNANIDASGACKVNGFELKVSNGKLEATGASNITISVSNELTADASGGSTIQYKGNATVKSMNTSAGATIKKRSGD